jgi:hypothetical protein
MRARNFATRWVRSLLAISAAAALASPALAGCDRYERNDLQILTAYSAKEMCSCIFVMQQSEEYCKAWTKASPNIKSVSVDYDKKRVESQALTLVGATARYVSPRRGCVLE